VSDTIYIYGLKEVDSDEIRYVGQTCDVKMRRYTHLSSKDGQIDHPKRLWIENAKRRGIEIESITLEECGDGINEVEREQYWIDHYESLGHRLTNVDKAKPSAYRRKRSTVIKTKTIETVVTDEKITFTPSSQPSAYDAMEDAAIRACENFSALEDSAISLAQMLLGSARDDVNSYREEINRSNQRLTALEDKFDRLITFLMEERNHVRPIDKQPVQ